MNSKEQSARKSLCAWESVTKDCIDVKKIYIDAATDLIAGILLSQIIYWNLPDRDGYSKLRIKRDGYLWLAKSRSDWWDECRIGVRQFDRAIALLEKNHLVICQVFKFKGVPTKHIRVNFPVLVLFIKENTSKYEKSIPDEMSPDITDSLNDLPDLGNSLTDSLNDLPKPESPLIDPEITRKNKNSKSKNTEANVCEKPQDLDVAQNIDVANESRQPQDKSEVQEVEYTSLDDDPDINITPHSAAPPNIPQTEKNSEVVNGELVVLEVVQTKYGANRKGQEMPPNLKKIWDEFWSGKNTKLSEWEWKDIATYEIGDILGDIVVGGYWSSMPRFKQDFVNFRIADGLKDDGHARNRINQELHPKLWDTLRGKWQAFKLNQRGMTTKQAMSKFKSQEIANSPAVEILRKMRSL